MNLQLQILKDLLEHYFQHKISLWKQNHFWKLNENTGNIYNIKQEEKEM